VNAAGQGDRKETTCGANDQPDGLTGVAEDEFRFGVIVRLLMQLLDGRHFPACFGDLDSVCHEDDASLDRIQRSWQTARLKQPFCNYQLCNELETLLRK
jgi:hypothetical protein